jgi:hypothetical protein
MVKALRDATSDVKPRAAANKWVTAAAVIFMIALSAVVAFLLLRRPPVLPEGTEPDEGAQLVQAGGKRYYDRIVRPMPDGTHVRFLLIPATAGDDLKSFYIMEDKVSNRLFEQFAEAESESVHDSQWRKGPAIDGKEAGIQDKDWPVFHVTVAEAHAFAQWMGGRLPSARQWDRAAGLDTNSDSPGPYKTPWNETSKTEIAINREMEGPLPVGSAPGDISPSGCRDMAGNGYEWTRTLMRPFSGYVPREYPNVESHETENEKDMVLLRGQSYINQQPLRYE